MGSYALIAWLFVVEVGFGAVFWGSRVITRKHLSVPGVYLRGIAIAALLTFTFAPTLVIGNMAGYFCPASYHLLELFMKTGFEGLADFPLDPNAKLAFKSLIFFTGISVGIALVVQFCRLLKSGTDLRRR